jgi:acetylornithine deacetylase/succinyl-diaminopimelate desuccinylase-like protein
MNDAKAATTPRLDPARAAGLIERIWEREIVPALIDYIRIPNKSPHFDPEWQAKGHMRAATDLIEAWCRGRTLPGLTVERLELPGRTPLLFMELPGQGTDTVLLYGHLDKQPEMTGWRDGLGPWTPKREGDRLYGRGGADDGYAAFASLTALQALADQGVPHARCVVLIEACEESGSYDLPAYIDYLARRIGAPSLVVCLDSGCGDYERLWSTTSLRGNLTASLVVEILTEGVHSGDASGIVPDSFRLLRGLVSRLEDEASGEIRVPELHVQIPPGRIEQAKRAAAVLGERVYKRFPFVAGATPVARDLVEHVLARTWRPTLTVTGAEGLPKIGDAGNVLRPMTAAKLSLRLPPTLDGATATEILERTMLKDPPHGARVRLENISVGTGWNAPALEPWLAQAMDAASSAFFGRPAAAMGEGGSIPFMSMLGEKFPKAQFLITGVLGPEANAHGPNEFLHIPTGKRVTGSVAAVLADHFARAGAASPARSGN